MLVLRLIYLHFFRRNDLLENIGAKTLELISKNNFQDVYLRTFNLGFSLGLVETADYTGFVAEIQEMDEKLQRLSAAAYLRASLVSQCQNEFGEKLLAKISKIGKNQVFDVENFYFGRQEEAKIDSLMFLLRSKEWFPEVAEKLESIGLKYSQFEINKAKRLRRNQNHRKQSKRKRPRDFKP